MKYPIRRLFLYSILLFCLTHSYSAGAQQTTVSSDDLFQLARSAAFTGHDYPKAILLSKTALAKSPDYADIRVFLGRLYAWSHYPDSARQAFKEVLLKRPDNEEALSALADLESWNDHLPEALGYCLTGLYYHPGSPPLVIKAAKLLSKLSRYKEAGAFIDTLLRKDPRNTEARAMAAQIKDQSSQDKIGISYDYVYFNREFNDPWHLLSVDYSHRTAMGPVIGRINYANRFRTSGLQFEADAYPRISRVFYAYLNAGYSNDVGIFSRYRAGFSLYSNLPHSWEADAGFRYLYFSSDTWIYTLSAGKYYKNWWFNFRTYLTPGQFHISQSFTFSARCYYGGSDDYFSMGAGTGVSPDDRSNNIQLNGPYELKSNNLNGGYRHAIKKLNIIFAAVTLTDQEYLPATHGTQLDIGIGYQRKF